MKFLTRSVVLLAVLILIPALAPAQATCTAEGYVYDSDGNPMADVQVVLQYKGHIPQKYRTKTDKNGRFVHVTVWEGPYDITFIAEGVGEVTVNDFRMREFRSPEKPPTFTIGAQPPPAEEEVAEEAAPKGPTSEETAGALATELDRGNAALAEGKLDEAIAAYEAVAAKAPDLPEVHHNLGLAYRKKGEAEKAEAEFRQAADLDPDFAEPHGALAVMLANAGKRDEAIVEAEQAADLDPENVEYLYNLAVLYKDSGRSADAEKRFLELEEIDPDNAEIQFHLGTTLLALGRMDEAMTRLEKYVELAVPDAPNVASAKGMIDALRQQQ
jgi:Flp pilus assembly protein TadD